MIDKKKSINEYSNPEIAGALNRLRMEKEALVLMKDLKTRSLPNDKGPYPLYNIPESFSTESSINNGPSIKEMTDDELRDFIQLMSSKNEMISIIQNIRDMNNPRPLNEDGQVYEGISLDTPISDLYHFGVLGMRWGHRKSSSSGSNGAKEAKQLAKSDKNFEKKKNLQKVVSQASATINQNANFKKESLAVYTKLQKAGINGKTLDNAFQKSMVNVYDKYMKADKSTYSPSGKTRVSMAAVEFESGLTYLTPVLLSVDNVKHSNVDDYEGNGKFKVLLDGSLKIIEEALDDEFDKTDELLHEDVDAVLQHFGIPGMRWGVRKSRGKSSRAVPSEDYTTSRKIKKKKTKEMSNDELKKLTTRLNLERNLRDLESSDYQKGLNFVKTLTSAGTTVAGLYALSETPLGKAVISGAKRKLKGG